MVEEKESKTNKKLDLKVIIEVKNNIVLKPKIEPENANVSIAGMLQLLEAVKQELLSRKA